MKYVVLVGDGMADETIQELGGKTPLEYAETPNIDKIASKGLIGEIRTVPEGFPPGSDVANLALMGYDPSRFYTGRAPLEAASMGIKLGTSDVAYRCNLVTLEVLGQAIYMRDFTAGHISSEEAKILIEGLNEQLPDDRIRFYPGVSYRHLMVWESGGDDVALTPPHDILEQSIAEYLPQGPDAGEITKWMTAAQIFLKSHPINQERMAKGKNPANSIWLWGQGKRPTLPTFKELYNLTGGVVSAVDLVKGIGILAGLEAPRVEGATGYLDTNYAGKVDAALKILEKGDFVFIHVEAPDEAGHSGILKDKIRAIEDFDRHVVGPMFDSLQRLLPFRLLILPDHPTPLSIRTHTNGAVPFLAYDSEGNFGNHSDSRLPFSESGARQSPVKFKKGHYLMKAWLNGNLEPGVI
ncbi:MAG: cofactor-independent phosphoglycerate mutase [Deltaproteobacteria bacterium]|nr:MAG: cofactor-independent phosphoglycerate mutase [Deltaproteobacteria bacterium]